MRRLLLACLALGCERVVLYWMTPSEPFDPSRLPTAPDYAEPAQCRAGRLVVSLADRPPRDFRSRLLDRALGPGNFHPIEYQLFFADIRENAMRRLRSWIGSSSRSALR